MIGSERTWAHGSIQLCVNSSGWWWFNDVIFSRHYLGPSVSVEQCNKTQIISHQFLEHCSECTVLKWPPHLSDVSPVDHHGCVAGRAVAILNGGIKSSKLLCWTKQLLQETFSCSYCNTSALQRILKAHTHML